MKVQEILTNVPISPAQLNKNTILHPQKEQLILTLRRHVVCLRRAPIKLSQCGDLFGQQKLYLFTRHNPCSYIFAVDIRLQLTRRLLKQTS